MSTLWTTLHDNDGTWLWIAHRPSIGPCVYHVLEILDMDEAYGRDNEGRAKYCGDLKEVDLDTIPSERIRSAKQGYGAEEETLSDPAVAEMCAGYGAYAPLKSMYDGNRRKIERALKRDSADLVRDANAHEERMERPVNALGETAREYANGDMIPAVIRGIAAGNKNAEIIGRMMGLR